MKSFAKLVVGALLLTASMAQANDAGCGLGSLVIKQNTKLMQLFAVTTNGTFGSQTFGITSGTSGCSASGIVMKEKEIQYFAEVNHDALTKEMAQGGGEKLAILASMYGCDVKGQAAFGRMTQSNYQTIVPSEAVNTSDMIHNLNRTLIINKDVAQACSQEG